MLADGLGPAAMGRLLGVSDRIVRKWRMRWDKAPEPQSLGDADRPGVVREFPWVLAPIA